MAISVRPLVNRPSKWYTIWYFTRVLIGHVVGWLAIRLNQAGWLTEGIINGDWLWWLQRYTLGCVYACLVVIRSEKWSSASVVRNCVRCHRLKKNSPTDFSLLIEECMFLYKTVENFFAVGDDSFLQLWVQLFTLCHQDSRATGFVCDLFTLCEHKQIHARLSFFAW